MEEAVPNVQRLVQEAEKRGEFQGRVLNSLDSISSILGEMKAKHADQDAKIDSKVSKLDFVALSTEVKDLQKWRWYLAGGLVVISFFFSKLF